MRFPEFPRREQGENVIPLINIVFLLLVFFMLAGTLSAPDPFDVEPPESLEGVETAQPEEGVILLAADGRLALDGVELQLEQLTRRVEAWLAEESTEPVAVTVKADADVPAHRLLDLMDALRDAGLQRLTLLSTAVDS